jgi:hypothetical protein
MGNYICLLVAAASDIVENLSQLSAGIFVAD